MNGRAAGTRFQANASASATIRIQAVFAGGVGATCGAPNTRGCGADAADAASLTVRFSSFSPIDRRMNRIVFFQRGCRARLTQGPRLI